MSISVLGLVAGLALGFAGYFGGIGAFIVVAVLGLAGYVAGKFAEGEWEPGYFFRRRDDDQKR